VQGHGFEGSLEPRREISSAEQYAHDENLLPEDSNSLTRTPDGIQMFTALIAKMDLLEVHANYLIQRGRPPVLLQGPAL
jgi:hypothetical protein